MPSVVIDNPILNSPHREPARHLRFNENGITNEIAEGCRRSTYFMPIAQPNVHKGHSQG
jgi:type III restriction enzyme